MKCFLLVLLPFALGTVTSAQVFTVGNSFDTLTFKNQTNPYDYSQWDFGDGTFGQGDSVTHLYPDTANYSVCQYVSYQGQTDTNCLEVKGRCTLPISKFTYATFGLGFVATLKAINYDSLYWLIEDTLVSKIDGFFAHLFLSAGSYNVKLIAFGRCGNDTLSATVELFGNPPPPPLPPIGVEEEKILVTPFVLEGNTLFVEIAIGGLLDQLLITDLTGKQVFNQTIPSDGIISLKHLKTGIYQVSIGGIPETYRIFISG